MGASSVTGVSGPGVSGKATTNELSRWANGPQILISGIAHSESNIPPSSPPSESTTVTFPTPLPGLGEEHVVIITTLNGGYAYVTDMDDHDLDGDNEDDHFVGFTFVTEAPCDAMYIVAKIGQRVI